MPPLIDGTVDAGDWQTTAGLGDPPTFTPPPAWGASEFLLSLLLAAVVVSAYFITDSLEQIKRAINGERPL